MADNEVVRDLIDGGKFRDALRVALKNFEARPGDARRLLDVASSYFQLGDWAASEAFASRAKEFSTTRPAALILLSRCLCQRGRETEALDLLEQWVGQVRGNASFLMELASLYLTMGRMRKADETTANAYGLSPTHTAVLAALPDVSDPNLRRRLSQRVHESYRDVGASASFPDLPLIYARAWLYDQEGDVGRALDCWKTAAAIKQARSTYNHDRAIAVLQHVQNAKLKCLGDQLLGEIHFPKLVFIVGLPRSGSTLIEQILSLSPQTVCLGERPAIARALTYMSANFPSLPPFPQLLSNLQDHHIQFFRSSYLQEIADVPKGKVAVTKFLDDALYAQLIINAFPEAKFVLAERDPFATCMSIFTRNFQADIGYANDLRILGQYTSARLQCVRALRRRMSPDIWHSVRYENLVNGFEEEVERLLTFLQLSPLSSAREFHLSARPVRTASRVQVRHRLYSDANSRWERYRSLVCDLTYGLD